MSPRKGNLQGFKKCIGISLTSCSSCKTWLNRLSYYRNFLIGYNYCPLCYEVAFKHLELYQLLLFEHWNPAQALLWDV